MRTQLAGIRAQEAGVAVKMARIRACNMAMIFFIMPVASFITFAVVRCYAGPPDINLWAAVLCA